MKAIGIDIGTTTISGVVLDIKQERILEAKTIRSESFIKTEHEWEQIQDVSVIMKKARKLLDELLESNIDVQGIGLTGQMHGIVYLNKAGEPMSPLYTWQDGRGAIKEFDGHSIVEEVKEKTGVAVSTGFGLVTHLYNCRKNSVPEGEVTICTIADYLGMKLTGNSSPLVHVSNAAGFGFFDIENGTFRRDVLEKLGVNLLILPKVTREFCVLGTYKGIPVTVSIADNQAAFLGAVGFRENTVLLNMGTGGQISVLSEQPFTGNGIEARPFVKGKYLLVGASLCGGRAYALTERFFRAFLRRAGGKDEPLYGLLEQLAKDGMGRSDTMRVSTRFSGTRIEPDIRGNITNISGDNFTPEGLVYGILEGMAGELYDMYQIMHKATGIKALCLVASGNGLRKNETLQKICSQMFDTELMLAPYQEEAACGAAVSCSMGYN